MVAHHQSVNCQMGTLKKFRQAFKIVDRDALRWFPGHMTTSFKDMQRKLVNVDCVIEVHDARIPFSGRNPTFKSHICGHKPHILVLNKRDLVSPGFNVHVVRTLKEHQKIDHVLYTNCRNENCKGLRELFPLMQDLVKKSERYHRTDTREYLLLIIGVPNVGKSSLINMIRSKNTDRGAGTPVGGVAGITRSVLNRILVSKDPPIYMLDTPGILTPNVPDPEGAMKLALCAALQDHLVGEDVIADYLLYHMNKGENFKYVQYMGLDEPSDSIAEVLTKTAVHMKRYKKLRAIDGRPKFFPDHIYAATHFINGFRTGELGPAFLDKDVLYKLNAPPETK